MSPRCSGYKVVPVPIGEQIYSVSQLNREARQLLEQGLPALWIAGEISNLARPASGHIYFSIKDNQAQVRCAMFRGNNNRLPFKPENGQQVLLHARVGLYEARGEFQLVAEHMEPAGEGLLRQQLEKLKASLAAEGLFDDVLKQSIPTIPHRVGIITSPTSAAVRDILHILERRFPAVPVVIYPVQVQGDPAKHDIVAKLKTAAERNECDVLILARGGGSLEDLWAFNEEIVIRAIHACPIPVVAGVGHETDFTLTDLVADVRAPTPSGAAELVVPDCNEWAARFESLGQRAARAVQRILRDQRFRIEQVSARLERCHPGTVLHQHAQRLDDLTLRLRKIIMSQLTMRQVQLTAADSRLRSAAPGNLIRRYQDRLMTSRLKLDSAMTIRLTGFRNRLAVAAAGLQAVSPLSTLERGYAVIQDDASGKVITDSAELKIGQTVSGRLARGGFEAEITKPKRT